MPSVAVTGVEDMLQKRQQSKLDAKFERIVGLRFGGRAEKVELVVGRPDFSNVLWTNKVSTTKYKAITFVPHNLWEQFHNFANLYFLMAATLQLIPATSDSQGIPTVLFALIPVLLVTMAKDGWEDYQRDKNDKKENQRIAKRVIRIPQRSESNPERPGTEALRCAMEEFVTEEVFWEELRVGDVIQLTYGDGVPADVILLSTSGETGTTYVETKNLDGETNLKGKVTHPKVQAAFSTYTNRVQSWLEARITYEGPSTQLYTFSGEIQLGDDVHPLEANQLILRGSSLQGDTALGVVVYTGHHTRVYRNSAKSVLKRSRLGGWYNRHVVSLVLLQMTFVFFISLMYVLTLAANLEWYLGINPDTLTVSKYVEEFIVVFGRVMLMFTYYIPITLIVTLEIVRMLLAQFIMRDEAMKQNDSFVNVNTANVIEDLGCVSHIFSDKTGTLTQNLMTFAAVALPNPICVSSLSIPHDPDDAKASGHIENCPAFCDPKFPKDLLLNCIRGQKEAEMEFAKYLLIIALCHTVTIRTKDDGSEILDASSPDELALVCGAQVLGIEFKGRPTPSTCSFELSKEGLYFFNLATGCDLKVNETTCEILATLDFDNVRKRMSVVARVGEKIFLLCKGADSSMIPLSLDKYDNSAGNDIGEAESNAQGAADKEIADRDKSSLETLSKEDFNAKLEWLDRHLDAFSVRGLRTLVLGIRELSEVEYDQWSSDWNTAKTHVGRAVTKQTHIEKCIERVERDLTIVGATGVEDRLQEEVPEVIASLQKAGLKVWVLTGDKVETAINIATSCDLITSSTYACTFENRSTSAIVDKIDEVNRYLQAGKFLLKEGFELDWAEEEKKEAKNQRTKEKQAREKQKKEQKFGRKKEPEVVRPQTRPKTFVTLDVSEVDERIEIQRKSTSSGHANDHTSKRIARGSPSAFSSPRKMFAHMSSSAGLPAAATSGFSPNMPSSPSGARVMQPSTAAEMPTFCIPREYGNSLKETLAVEDNAQVLVFDKVCIVVTGDCMHTILGDTALRRQFFHLALGSCESIICCRVTPIQKSLVVIWSQLYLESQNLAMLAIGDGANDVGMILSARVGVGIQGKEGSQASRSADFSIPQFKYLKRLMFVHGREAYRRNAFLMYFVCYKNVAFCMTGFFINLFTEYSGSDHYDPYLKQLFNTAYTIFPITLYALFDLQYPTEILHKSTSLYIQDYPGAFPIAGHSTFAWWFGVAIYGATACSFIPLLAFTNLTVEDQNVLWMGHCIYVCVCIPTNFLILPESYKIYFFTLPMMLLGIILYYGTWVLTSGSFLGLGSLESYGQSSFAPVNEIASFWFSLLLAGFISMIPPLVYHVHINNQLTAARIVTREFEKHKRDLKKAMQDNKDLHEQAKADVHFWTRTFDPEEAVAKYAERKNAFLAVVPSSRKRESPTGRTRISRNSRSTGSRTFHTQRVKESIGVGYLEERGEIVLESRMSKTNVTFEDVEIPRERDSPLTINQVLTGPQPIKPHQFMSPVSDDAGPSSPHLNVTPSVAL